MGSAGSGQARGDLPSSLVDLAATGLRDRILSGDLRPGEKIVEEDLCARLGISRGPLREALRLLTQQGLVEHLPRRGSRVVEWSPDDVLQLFELRSVLERHAVESALPLADPSTALEPVRAALAVMRSAKGGLERDDAHRTFHAAVVGLAANRQLDFALEPILLKLQVPMARNLREEARRQSVRDGIARHEELLQALEGNDPDLVVKALHEHGHLTYLGLRSGA
jgi:DNA-binding GntR family transcriptional regulator